MRNETIYKLVIITLALYVFLSGFFSYKFVKQIKSLKSENEKLSSQVDKLENENEVLDNELQLREDEVAYWGMKYDSIKVSLNKK
jgi:hypothetical protein